MPQPKRTHLAPGLRLGSKYQLLRPLGEGAMGVVWAALNERTLSQVAVKLIAGTEPEFRMRLLREARSCGQLHHRNIIDIYDVETTEHGEPFLVMKLLTGETLSKRLKRLRRLDPSEAALIGRDIARALAAAHAKHIIHRDLKPANVFLEEEEGTSYVVKVLDFGVSKNLAIGDEIRTVTGAAVGSLPYMSPEQAIGRRDIDHRSDIWSLGVVLFEMLAGTRPFRGSMPEMLVQITKGAIPKISELGLHVNGGLMSILDRCLERRAEDRVSSAAELAKLLEPYARAERRDASEAHAPVEVPLAVGADNTTRMQTPKAPPGVSTTPLPLQASAALEAPDAPTTALQPSTASTGHESTTLPWQRYPAPPGRQESTQDVDPSNQFGHEGPGGTVRLLASNALKLPDAHPSYGKVGSLLDGGTEIMPLMPKQSPPAAEVPAWPRTDGRLPPLTEQSPPAAQLPDAIKQRRRIALALLLVSMLLFVLMIAVLGYLVLSRVR